MPCQPIPVCVRLCKPFLNWSKPEEEEEQEFLEQQDIFLGIRLAYCSPGQSPCRQQRPPTSASFHSAASSLSTPVMFSLSLLQSTLLYIHSVVSSDRCPARGRPSGPPPDRRPATERPFGCPSDWHPVRGRPARSCPPGLHVLGGCPQGSPPKVLGLTGHRPGCAPEPQGHT